MKALWSRRLRTFLSLLQSEFGRPLECRPEKCIAREGRFTETCRDHGLLHLPDAHADEFDLVQAEEKVRNQLIPSDRNRAEVPDRQAFRQAAVNSSKGTLLTY